MAKNFNEIVGESRKGLEIIDSHKLNNMIESGEDMVVLDVNDKEDVERGEW